MRTWDENRTTINQLWPTHAYTEEEANLVREDLSPLDQSTLYDAIRNAKRHHDTPFVHLKWLLDEYRELASSKKAALKSPRPREPKLDLRVDEKQDRTLREQFIAWIDECEPKDFGAVETKVLDSLPKMNSASAVRVLLYARARLLGQEVQFSRVSRDGSVAPLPVPQEGF